MQKHHKVLTVRDTELTVLKGVGHNHHIVRRKERLTDGVRHPVKILRMIRGEWTVTKRIPCKHGEVGFQEFPSHES